MFTKFSMRNSGEVYSLSKKSGIEIANNLCADVIALNHSDYKNICR